MAAPVKFVSVETMLDAANWTARLTETARRALPAHQFRAV